MASIVASRTHPRAHSSCLVRHHQDGHRVDPHVDPGPGAQLPRPRPRHLRDDVHPAEQPDPDPRDRAQKCHVDDDGLARRIHHQLHGLRAHQRRPGPRTEPGNAGTRTPSTCTPASVTRAAMRLLSPTNSATNGEAGAA